ncbi:MAG: nucleotidyltransferase domain-containing protein [Atopobiaceae bacterium]|nr:nucleotidyltransferase domain-containing protein [Atopobiaceae bacterium]
MASPVTHHSIPLETRQLVAQRYRVVTWAVNRSLWDVVSDTAHSLYVGSYGRGTAVDTSDVDVLVEVPSRFYVRPDYYSTYNPQSRLLQVVKEAVLSSYPRSSVRADGQVVVVDFSDGMKFEVLPAIREQDGWGGTHYRYPDTHMGGNWMSTDPKSEQGALAERDRSSNGLLKDTCKLIGGAPAKLSGRAAPDA